MPQLAAYHGGDEGVQLGQMVLNSVGRRRVVGRHVVEELPHAVIRGE